MKISISIDHLVLPKFDWPIFYSPSFFITFSSTVDTNLFSEPPPHFSIISL